MNRETDGQVDEVLDDADRLAPILRRLLAELDGIERRAVVGSASRRLIRHGRSLDSLLWRAHRQWKEYNRNSDGNVLDALCRTLNAAQEDADQLRLALEVTSAPLSSRSPDARQEPEPAEPHPGGEIDEVRSRLRDLLDGLERRLTSVAEVDRPSGDLDAGPVREPFSPRAPEDSAALEGMLRRITSDWQHLQRSPSPDRIALLCDKLERASHEVRRLASDIENASRHAVPDPLTPSVSSALPPFRDAQTGALSREGFDALVIGELKRSRRYRRPFTLLLVEAPGSNSTGVAETLERLAAGLRGSDYVGRHVDRLIAVGLPETTSEAAQIAARRVMRSISTDGGDGIVPRFGLASLPEDGRTLAELAALARHQLRSGSTSPGESGRDYWGV